MLTETSTWVTGGKGRSQEQESSIMSTVINSGTRTYVQVERSVVISYTVSTDMIALDSS